MTTTRPARYLATVSLLVALVACGGNSDSAPEETAPPPSRASTTTVDPTDSAVSTTASTSTTSPTTSAPPVTTADSLPDTTATTETENGGSFLPDDLGRRVDSVPGVDTPGEIVELLENVWIFIPTEGDPNDASVVPPLPEDADIIAAYAEAEAAVHEQFSTDPLPAEPTDRLTAALTEDVVNLYVEQVLGPRSAAGEHLDTSAGVLLRPVVVADPRSDTEAIIFDCVLDGGNWVTDDGTLAEGETPGIDRFPVISRV